MFEFLKNLVFGAGSGTIAIARATTLSGAVLAVLAGMDWSTILSATGLNWKQGVLLGVSMFAHGVITELTRRNGTVTVQVDGQPVLVPTKIAEVTVK